MPGNPVGAAQVLFGSSGKTMLVCVPLAVTGKLVLVGGTVASRTVVIGLRPVSTLKREYLRSVPTPGVVYRSTKSTVASTTAEGFSRKENGNVLAPDPEVAAKSA